MAKAFWVLVGSLSLAWLGYCTLLVPFVIDGLALEGGKSAGFVIGGVAAALLVAPGVAGIITAAYVTISPRGRDTTAGRGFAPVVQPSPSLPDEEGAPATTAAGSRGELGEEERREQARQFLQQFDDPAADLVPENHLG